jgi:flagellar hook-basal body complex protein FliE
MMIDGVSAINAAKTQVSASAPAASTSAASGASFTDILGQVVGDTIGTLQTGEAAAIQGLQGSLPPFKVVESIMSAQRTLQQALAIRDKAVSAYQEISRMTI